MSKLYVLIVDETPSLTIIYKEYIFNINYQIKSLMKRLLHKNYCFRKCLTKTKKQIVETIQLFNATTLEQMNEEKKIKK